MSLRILCAGCSAEEREQAEADVRRALAARGADEAWTVSLVKMRDRWSITLDGPGTRGRSWVAPEAALGESIRSALGGGGAPPSPGPAAPAAVPAASAGHRRDRHECTACRKPFVVIYQAVPDEAEEMAAVACPHCWQINYVLVAESAAESRDYSAERA